MGLYYIKGTPGSGKTTIRTELRKLGYETHDTDDDDIGSAYNNQTNERTTVPDIQDRSPEWFETHSWRIIAEAIKRLHEKAKDRPIFLCGTASNENEVSSLFDKVFFLDIDKRTLKKRIAQRTDNDYGQTSEELELIMAKYKKDRLKRNLLDVITIDATLPVHEVVRSILDNV